MDERALTIAFERGFRRVAGRNRYSVLCQMQLMPRATRSFKVQQLEVVDNLLSDGGHVALFASYRVRRASMGLTLVGLAEPFGPIHQDCSIEASLTSSSEP
jgi:hypothetical protein